MCWWLDDTGNSSITNKLHMFKQSSTVSGIAVGVKALCGRYFPIDEWPYRSYYDLYKTNTTIWNGKWDNAEYRERQCKTCRRISLGE